MARQVAALPRHRWVRGPISAKCDLVAAVQARREHGGRVDASRVLVFEDGSEVLGPWELLLPDAEPTQ